jgi:hypothetical protein
MISNFMTFPRGTTQDIRILFNTLTEDEKGHLDVSFCEEIEQLGSEGGVRSVIKRHGDDRFIDMDRVESDARLGWRS